MCTHCTEFWCDTYFHGLCGETQSKVFDTQRNTVFQEGNNKL